MTTEINPLRTREVNPDMQKKRLCIFEIRRGESLEKSYLKFFQQNRLNDTQSL
ncbi:hypothetical protein LBBP_03915 [Leptospira borgpetersenii serovar Ballum]|nr:hypothetical protein LBBP_03915 [Leptospira borgpetersenii serovar Ballum]